MADDGLLGLAPRQQADALLGLGAWPLDDPVMGALHRQRQLRLLFRPAAGANRDFGGIRPDPVQAARDALAHREPGWYYGSVLPFRARGQEKEWAIPGILRDAGVGILDLAMGRTETAPNGATILSPYATLALLGLGGGPRTVASRSAGLYDPPVKALRPFEADYPTGATADAAGRLATDIEGRPLGARTVVGRNVVGGDDVAFPQAESNALTEAGTGALPSVVPAREMGQDAAHTVVDPITGLPLGVRLRSNLTPGQAIRVHAHENAHVIDQLAGEIDITGLNAELRQIYNTLNTGRERTRNLMGPQHLGYTAAEQPRELMAEAIRAYMADPNYLKTVAPRTAARIRAAVNANARIAPFIQFNELLGLGATGVGAGALLVTSPQQ